MAPTILPAAQVEQLDFSEAVTVAVGDGDSKQQFLLHKNIISRHSKFFRKALSGNFFEAKKKSINVPEGDVATFKLWIQWAYSGNIVLLSASEQEHQNDDCALARKRCGKLYVLADALEDTLCRNTVTDLLKKKLLLHHGPSAELCKIAYEHTPENSKLRKLCLDWLVINPSGTWLRDHRDRLPPALFADLAIEWGVVADDQSWAIDPFNAPKCKYHDHDTEVPACEEGPEESPASNKTT
ncbi:hypothetical protein AC578_7057 [Pseudocercospora eumusae]|uniref:BTB domain-containing protein n=1 Tax=Pseudocercospora eumusae TaxID=321146 RepID=A0A139GWN7_9PEZI|nr:hypothetical protein AC578_7057 [Pseudocercospora eumusae]